MSNYPEAAYPSKRAFQRAQRKAIRQVLKAIDESDLMLGCAYSPAYKKLVEARECLEAAKDAMRVSEWK